MIAPTSVIGFDLDMTLIDSRPGLRAVMEAIEAKHGFGIDGAAATAVLGPPLDQLLSPWVPAEDMPAIVDEFRALYPELAIESTLALPGAHEALSAARDAGAHVLVLTGKYEPNAKLHARHLALPHDELIGSKWASAKAHILAERDAVAYVGDHPADMRAAREANVRAVGVPTGGISADELRAAGADVVLDSLHDFASWLTAL